MSGKSHPTLRPCTRCKLPTRSLYQIHPDCVEKDLPAMEKKVWERLKVSRVWLLRRIV